ncbi:zinc finger, CCHC-type containing protein [Tanacetum coccineum]
MAAAMKRMASSFAKLEKFEGVNFRRWQKKMHFMLSSMSVVYVLTTPMPEDGGENPTDPLEAKYMVEDASSKKFLVSNFTNYKMTDSRPVLEQYNELLGIIGRFTQHKMNMDESIQVSCIIDKLPPSWKDFKHTLKHLKEELTLVELGSHLRIEESLRAQDNDKPKGNNVAIPSVVNMVEHNNSSRHLKKDCKSGNVGNKASGSGTKGSKDGSSNPLKGQSMFNKSHQIYYVTYVSEAFYVQNDDVAWWVDSGATVHVCKDRCWFKTYKSLNDGSILHMGNESTALMHGRGCVDLKFSSGKVVFLLNVLHVPNIRKNLVSSSVLNNCGYKQVIESNKFDFSKHGVFIGFGYLSNHMFRLNIISNNIGLAFMSTSKLNDSILWHARLGHVHFKRMQDMSKDGLLPAFNMDTEKAESRAVVRLLGPKLKTLGERGIECIFVGYVEHSKALRFYVIEPNDSVVINSIIESRDAIFDENRPLGYKWIFKRKLKVDGTVEKFKARLVIQGFKQKSGIDHFDMYALVTRISTIRLLIALASIHSLIIHQMDVKIAFLNGDLDEEASKQWHQKFDEVVLSNGYLLNQADKCVYRKFDESGKGVIICLYVDDILIFGTDQSHYIEKVLKKFNYFDYTLVSTPLDTCEKLMPNKGLTVSQLEYSRVIGYLMYAMTYTRPDIAFAVGKLSMYTSNLCTQHWQAIQRVLKYLKKTMDYRLRYTGYPSVLEGYTDASWIGNTGDNLSTSGWVFMLGGGAISWASKKQTCIIGSTMESEFVALAAAGKEAECGATLKKAYSQMYNRKSRHLGVRHSMIRELITNGVVSIEFVRSEQNLADHLTKGLARDLVIKSA